MLVLKHGEPMVFGKDHDKGIRLRGLQPEVVELGGDVRRRRPAGPRRDGPGPRVPAVAHVLPGLPGARWASCGARPAAHPRSAGDGPDRRRDREGAARATCPSCCSRARPGPSADRGRPARLGHRAGARRGPHLGVAPDRGRAPGRSLARATRLGAGPRAVAWRRPRSRSRSPAQACRRTRHAPPRVVGGHRGPVRAARRRDGGGRARSPRRACR